MFDYKRLPLARSLMIMLCSFLYVISGGAPALAKSVSENKKQVIVWNRFADNLLEAHNKILKERKIRKKEEVGGYAGRPDFYREESYFDAATGHLLSRVRWENSYPAKLHVIELFYYDKTGRISREYTAAYLPRFRNAPFQTLINLHHYSNGLHAMRQFNASGTRIFEHCRGKWFGESVLISLDEPLIATPDSLLQSEAYIGCFGYLPARVGRFINPQARIPSGIGKETNVGGDEEINVALIDLKLKFSPKNASLYIDRGNAYLKILNFKKAIKDFTQAIKLDDTLDQAYFGRGMARGRIGMIDEGIADLSIYLKRNPKSSLAYTKRGVRYIWKGDFESAQKDLRRAIELNPNNAEAHDDLGVILARKRDYTAALKHFRTTIKIEPSYQKAHHNLALVLHLIGRNEEALEAIDDALKAGPDTRSTVLLKSAVLTALGRNTEALTQKKKAEALPQKNWSENLSIK